MESLKLRAKRNKKNRQIEILGSIKVKKNYNARRERKV